MRACLCIAAKIPLGGRGAHTGVEVGPAKEQCQCTARLWPIWHLILSLGCCTVSLPAACTASSCTSSRLDSKLLLVAALKGLLTYT